MFGYKLSFVIAQWLLKVLLTNQQKWSLRGHSLMSLASKVKSLVSKPASPQKCPVLGQEQHYVFDLLKMGHAHDLFFLRFGACQRPRRNFMKTFFFLGERPKFCGKVGINLCENLLCFIGERLNFAKNLKFFCAKTYLFGEHLHVVFLVLGLEIVCRQKVGPRPRIFLCPWPSLRALCPRLHLYKSPMTT